MAHVSATAGSILIKSVVHCRSGLSRDIFPTVSCTPFQSKGLRSAISCQLQYKSAVWQKKGEGELFATGLVSSYLTSWEARGHLGTLQFAWFQRGVFSVKKEKASHPGGTLVRASFMGVGAPEVLVIAVVALLVFGPKGLAEVARTLGKSLRAFQPTIRELQEVSRDFKQTLEKEIGLDELRAVDSRPSKSVFTVNEQPEPSLKSNLSTEDRAYSAQDYSKITEEQLKAQAYVSEEQRQAAAAAAWGDGAPTKLNGEIVNNESASKQDKV